MANLQKIVKVTQAQYDTLASGGTVGSYTGLNDNYVYLVENDTEYLPVINYTQSLTVGDIGSLSNKCALMYDSLNRTFWLATYSVPEQSTVDFYLKNQYGYYYLSDDESYANATTIASIFAGKRGSYKTYLTSDGGDIDYLQVNNGGIYPNETGSASLGQSARKWKDLYLSGSLKDGTNSITVANIQEKVQVKRYI